jgi:hypothetical protein
MDSYLTQPLRKVLAPTVQESICLLSLRESRQMDSWTVAKKTLGRWTTGSHRRASGLARPSCDGASASSLNDGSREREREREKKEKREHACALS